MSFGRLDFQELYFFLKAFLMKRLGHPNILLFMGAVTSPQCLCIITEFLPRYFLCFFVIFWRYFVVFQGNMSCTWTGCRDAYRTRRRSIQVQSRSNLINQGSIWNQFNWFQIKLNLTSVLNQIGLLENGT